MSSIFTTEHNGVRYQIENKKSSKSLGNNRGYRQPEISEIDYVIIHSMIDMGIDVDGQKFIVFDNEIKLNITFTSAPFTVFEDGKYNDSVKKTIETLKADKEFLSSIELLSVNDTVGKTTSQLIDAVAYKIVDGQEQENFPVKIYNTDSFYERSNYLTHSSRHHTMAKDQAPRRKNNDV